MRPYNGRGYKQRLVDGKIKFEHIRVAELAIGHKLPNGAEVHHLNEQRADFRAENLVICQDKAYHKLLHTRMKAYRETGDVHKRWCSLCKTWDDPGNMKMSIFKRAPNGRYRHAVCHRDAEYERKTRKAVIGD